MDAVRRASREQLRQGVDHLKVMGPMGALLAATKTNAEIIRQENNLGTIEAGKLADLILVDGNPLKDMAVFQDYHKKITLIMKGDSIYKSKI